MGTASVIRMPESNENIDISGRFDQGYRVAESNISFGTFVKAVGVLAGAVTMLGTIAFSERSADSLLLGAFLAVTCGLALYSLGAILCAQGQMLRATLDAAANSSPFLTTAAKAKIMSLTRMG